jgi:phytanoyl-CoA hydroxylase
MSQLFGAQGDAYILLPDQIAQFQRDGYVILKAVLQDEELQPIEVEFERFIRGEVPGMGRDFCDMSGPYDRAFKDFSLVNAVLPRRYRAPAPTAARSESQFLPYSQYRTYS